MDEKKFSEFKLKLDIKPGSYHGATVRKNITQSLWKKIRIELLEQNNYKCSICGYEPIEENFKQLHAHEIEEYGVGELLCILKGIEIICIKCHAWHNIGRTFTFVKGEQLEDLKKHFMRVNNCTHEEYVKYLKLFKSKQRELREKEFEEMIKREFENNILDNTVLYRIECDIPYKEEVIKQLVNKGLYRFFSGEK